MTTLDITLEQLKTLIAEAVKEEVQNQMQIYAMQVEQNPKVRRLPKRKVDNRTLEEVMESIERNRWTPPPGSKSSHEMIREDRDAGWETL